MIKIKFKGKTINVSLRKIDAICVDRKISNEIIELIERKYSEKVKEDVFLKNREKIIEGIQALIFKNSDKIKELKANRLEIRIEIGYKFKPKFNENKAIIKIGYVLCSFLKYINYGFLFNISKNEFVYELDEETKIRLMLEML